MKNLRESISDEAFESCLRAAQISPVSAALTVVYLHVSVMALIKA